MENLCIFKLAAAGHYCWGSPGHWWPLLTSDDGIGCGVWVVTGRGGGREEIIYPRFIVKLLTALERLEPQPPGQTQPGSNATFKRELFSSFEMRLQSRSHVPRVLRTIVCRVSHEDTGTKTASGERAGAGWQGRLSNEQHWDLRGCPLHCPLATI